MHVSCLRSKTYSEIQSTWSCHGPSLCECTRNALWCIDFRMDHCNFSLLHHQFSKAHSKISSRYRSKEIQSFRRKWSLAQKWMNEINRNSTSLLNIRIKFPISMWWLCAMSENQSGGPHKLQLVLKFCKSSLPEVVMIHPDVSTPEMLHDVLISGWIIAISYFITYNATNPMARHQTEVKIPEKSMPIAYT